MNKKTTAPKNNSNSEKEQIQKTTEELLKFLQVEGDFTLTQLEDQVNINIETKESGIIIGYHGEVLEALQLILSLCVSKKIGRFIRFSVDVGDYKKNRTSWLKGLAASAKERTMSEKKDISLPNLKSWERREIHLSLQDDKDVITESIGEGKNRMLIVKPKTP